VTVLSHPSLAGMASGSGISGSTAWHGAFRFRQYLKGSKTETDEPDDDLRELEFKKNQYGPKGETLVLRYQRGLFLPVVGPSTLEKAAREAKADDVFLKLLRRFCEQGRNLSDKPTANAYAPRMFVDEPEAKEQQLRLPDMMDAMRRLFTAGRIRMQDYGRPSRPSFKMVATMSPARPLNGNRPTPVAPSPKSMGSAPAGSVCLHCQSADGVIERVANASVIGSKTETLHWECAEAWFKASQ
jgi:hypothetical protein